MMAHSNEMGLCIGADKTQYRVVKHFKRIALHFECVFKIIYNFEIDAINHSLDLHRMR